MSNSPSQEDPNAAKQSLSALMDGEATPAQTESACALWRSDASVRERWRTYHLIGDVMRSDELAGTAQRDDAFLIALRAKLAHEPVPLAPRQQVLSQVESASPMARPGLRWQVVSMATAAGFMAVAGAVMVLRPGGLGATDGVAPVLAGSGGAEVTTVNSKLIRDAQLDRYLEAHRRVANGGSVAVPGAIVRSVDTIAIDSK